MRIGRTIPPAAAPIYLRDIISGLKGIFRGQRELTRFESELKEYFGVKRCFLISSGKAALTLILKVLKEMNPDRDEVLIPAFTCYSVPSAIVRAGLKVRLCDISPDTLDFDFNQLPKSLELSADSLLAIIPTHLFGLPADINRLRALVDHRDIVILEDAAQTMGAEWKGKKLGTLGDVGFFSLGRGKALSTGEGGIIITNREDIAKKINDQLTRIPKYSSLDLIGLFLKAVSLILLVRPAFFWLPKSLPFLKVGDTIYSPNFKMRRMSAFQAGLAKGWGNKLKEFRANRATNARQWLSITKTNLLHNYSSENGSIPDMLRFPIKIDDQWLRARILRESNRKGLGIIHTYPDSIDGIQELKPAFRGEEFPVSKEIAHQLITLPIHSFISEEDKVPITKLISQINHCRL